METKKTCKDCRKYIPSGMDVTAPPYCWEKSDICEDFIPTVTTENVLRVIISMSEKCQLTIRSPFKKGVKWVVTLTPMDTDNLKFRPNYNGQGDDLPEAVMNAIKVMEEG